MWGVPIEEGYQKNQFANYKRVAPRYGSAVDTFVLLEERPDIRIRVEATLSSLFDRYISIEWDSGNLVPMATAGDMGEAYRLDREECHGIRELLVLLTHLYNDQYAYLIIDEPELNLHPQYQSFFMQEVRKVAGSPSVDTDRKVIFLITHSPFIVDVRSMDDLRSVLSFSSDHTAPTSIGATEARSTYHLESLIPRLNVHHKQLFFSDNPIFVEGILDARIIEAVQEYRGVSITAAGSCLVEVGGCEEVNKYLILCRALRKSAYFLYDLDSLFTGNLRQCIREDGQVVAFLASLGLGNDFGRYCGELDRKLSEAVKLVRETQRDTAAVDELRSHIEGLAANGGLKDKNLARARVAVLVDLAGRRTEIMPVITEDLAADIEGRLARIVEILMRKNVFLLPGGALEHYLPTYSGHRYQLNESAKRVAVDAEITKLASGQIAESPEQRYGALFETISRLPAKPAVNIDSVLIRYLSDYVHELQGLILIHSEWGRDQLNAHFATSASGFGKLFDTEEFERSGPREFSATIRIRNPDGRAVQISHETNAGMQAFQLTADVAATSQ